MNKEIPYPFRIDEIRFMRCFSAPSYRISVALMIGWVLPVGKHTISQVILTMRLHESRHFATIYRFLGKGQWHSYWTGVKRGILKVYWLPPIPVGVKGIEDLIPTIHPVKGKSTQDIPKLSCTTFPLTAIAEM